MLHPFGNFCMKRKKKKRQNSPLLLQKKIHSDIICVYPLMCNFVDFSFLVVYLFCSCPRFLTVSFLMVLRQLKQTLWLGTITQKMQYLLVLSTFSVPKFNFSYQIFKDEAFVSASPRKCFCRSLFCCSVSYREYCIERVLRCTYNFFFFFFFERTNTTDILMKNQYSISSYFSFQCCPPYQMFLLLPILCFSSYF